jgi:hypothetical protein
MRFDAPDILECTHEKALAPGEAPKGDSKREAVGQDRDADGLIPRVHDRCGSPSHILGVHAVREDADSPSGAGNPAMNEEGSPDRTLERAERDLRRVCTTRQRQLQEA